MAYDTLKRAGLWALGRFLPRQNVLEAQLRNIIKGGMLLVMGGLILTAVFIGGLIGLHMTLISQGLHPGMSAAIIGFIALLSAWLCFVQADKVLKEVSSALKGEDRKPFVPPVQLEVAVQEGIALAFNAFLGGLRGKSETPPAPQPDLFEVEVTEEEAVVHFPRKRGKK